MTHIYHHAKFRWTENLTLRFIRLRKENGKLFTGRKYSAQAGWEHILGQMKSEFPTIMADVHYRVLKKKWSNLLQQYKELKNPVHGDKNNADDVSWPFYSALDEIVTSSKTTQFNKKIIDQDSQQVDPHEFLCVSVSSSDDQSLDKISPCSPKSSSRSSKIMNSNLPPDVTTISRKRIRESPSVDESQLPQAPLNFRSNTYGVKTKIEMTPLVNVRDVTKLRRKITENHSRVPQQQHQQRQQLHIIRTAVNQVKRANQSLDREHNTRLKRVCKTLTSVQRNQTYPPMSTSSMLNVNENHHSELIRKLNEFFVYTKRRDEENRIILIRILESVEKIASKID
ncbi:uncharacterized protein LOC103578037 isoform X1 [Microplitis demolitor]|uniref:uncharacterized protein LOC103578037 isoform X1 n=2 Tax=Microplitis demolitor TaxID=69319 RepID=UPI0004CD0328|nr:uncharacterized protein LOC103578037 isoform X1 [Microplitis demolitor]